MTYIDQTALVERHGSQILQDLTDKSDPPAGAINALTVATACAEASALIDGYASARYKTPLNPVPPQIPPIARAIAFYKLHSFEPDPKIVTEYKDALAHLKQIGHGTLRLPSEGIEPTGVGSTGAQVTDRERPMTAAKMKGFI
jgi:phage gp36-like protein